MDVESVLLITGIVFVGLNVASLIAIALFYGPRILATLRLPANLKEPLCRHEELAQACDDLELQSEVSAASV